MQTNPNYTFCCFFVFFNFLFQTLKLFMHFNPTGSNVSFSRNIGSKAVIAMLQLYYKTLLSR